MPVEWYLMTQPQYYSGFEDEELEAYAQSAFEDTLNSYLADDVKIYEKRMNITPIKTRAIIQGVTADTYNNSVLRQFLCRIGTLKCGDYIKTRNQTWLVYSEPDNNKVYEKAIAWRCKYSIHFISPTTGGVVEYPVYDINSTQYGSGQTAKTYLTVGTANHLIYIPYNEETIKIDSGFRFLIDRDGAKPTAYKLAQVDPTSYACGDDGVIQWTVTESTFDDKTDNAELMVADYYGQSEYSKSPTISTSTGTHIALIPENPNSEVIFGESLKVNISFLDGKTAIDPLDVTVAITDGGSFATLTDVGEDYFVITATDDRRNIGREITVTVENEENEISENIVLRIRGWY